MKRTVAIALAAGLGLSLLAGCSGGAKTGGDTIKIGVNYELSGDVAQYGMASAKGVEFAAEQINAGGGINGKKIELVKYDTKSEPSEATTMAQKLIGSDKVVAIIGPATSGSFKAEVPVANEKKVPIVSGSATADDVTLDKSGKVQPYVFRTCYTDSFQGTAMANYATGKLAAKKAVVIGDISSDYAKGLKKNFSEQFTKAGGQITGEESYNKGDTDFNAILTRVKGLDYDVIYLPGYYNEAGLIIKAARGLGIDKPILGPDGFGDPKLAELAGAAALNKVFFTSHYSSLDKDPAVEKFVADYKAKYNAEPGQFEALGYDTMKFVADAIKRAGSTDGPAIQKAMAETKDFVGVTGKFSIDANHNPEKSVVVVGLKDGKEATSEKSGK